MSKKEIYRDEDDNMVCPQCNKFCTVVNKTILGDTCYNCRKEMELHSLYYIKKSKKWFPDKQFKSKFDPKYSQDREKRRKKSL